MVGLISPRNQFKSGDCFQFDGFYCDTHVERLATVKWAWGSEGFRITWLCI